MVGPKAVERRKRRRRLAAVAYGHQGLPARHTD
jgi:hypothetical protein